MRISCIVFDILEQGLTDISSKEEETGYLYTRVYLYRDEYNRLIKCLEVYDYIQGTDYPIIVLTKEME